MWYEFIDKNKFLLKLYNSIPLLLNVDIQQLDLSDYGSRITLKFNMPNYADNPPKKWIDANYNTAMIQLDFFCVRKINFKSSDRKYYGNIEIYKDIDSFIYLDIQGSIELHLIAEACVLQSIEGYCSKV